MGRLSVDVDGDAFVRMSFEQGIEEWQSGILFCFDGEFYVRM